MQTSNFSDQTDSVFVTSEIKSPVGFRQMEETYPAGNFTADASATLTEKEIINTFDYTSANQLILKESEDTTKVEPKFEPLVLGGTATAVGGLALGLAGLFGAGVLLIAGAALLIISAIITMIGWKKIKAEPKKFKGEKLALLNYIIIGISGVAASFYLLYLLFTF